MSDTVSDISKRCASLRSLLYSVEQSRSTARPTALPISVPRLPFAFIAHGFAWVLRAALGGLATFVEVGSTNVKEGPDFRPAPLNKSVVIIVGK